MEVLLMLNGVIMERIILPLIVMALPCMYLAIPEANLE
nr:MAG TPA: hypothetical protein [Bacteriophage sp.]